MGTVWDRAAEFLSDNLSAIIPLALFTILIPAAISQSIAPLAVLGGSAALTINILTILLFVLARWGEVAIIALALDATAGRAEAMRTATRRLVPVIALLLLILAGYIVLLLPIGIALGMSGVDFQAAMNGGAKVELPSGLNWFISLYCIAFVVAVIWLAARLTLLIPTVIMERRGIGAIARSFKLTRRIQWKILGVLILYAIVALVSFLAAKLVFGSIFGLIAGGDGLVTVATVLTAIMVSIVITAFSVLALAFTGKLYLMVRDAREAIVESA
jgi:hypothetical protein